MSERGQLPVDASFACPFVAFEDDRDARSDVPDPRHRCFAELRPAPRAIAHQQAYCLSSGFATCPTFVDWAQREAARVRPSEPSGRGAGLASAAGLAGAAALSLGPDESGDASGAEQGADEQVWPRRSDREWAAPPPWSADRGSHEPEYEEADEDESVPPPFLADRGSGSPTSPGSRPSTAAAAGAGLAAAADHRPSYTEAPDEDEYEEALSARRPTAGRSSSERRHDDAAARPAAAGPSWEAPRRYEAYPTLRSPRSMPNLSPLLLAVAALVIGALALFFIPPLLLGLGGHGSATPTPSPSASTSLASPSAAASASAAPSAGPVTYTVKQGDTMTSIARTHGVDVNALIAANPQIKNPNNLSIGDVLTIPTPSPSVISAASPSPSP